ncbi:MAG: hypothetical protein NVV82_11935 [Sporocytophaga sp.]|jgi:hypothetical protein|nr:hypothetical protein [Sporocytophaga sp.]
MEETFNESIKRELEILSNSPILMKEYRQKKLLLWLVRTLMTILIYVLFWEYNWVKWTLILTVPLNLFSLFTIVGSGYLLKRKIEKLRNKLNDANQL